MRPACVHVAPRAIDRRLPCPHSHRRERPGTAQCFVTKVRPMVRRTGQRQEVSAARLAFAVEECLPALKLRNGQTKSCVPPWHIALQGTMMRQVPAPTRQFASYKWFLENSLDGVTL
jgi:hypothetical protein